MLKCYTHQCPLNGGTVAVWIDESRLGEVLDGILLLFAKEQVVNEDEPAPEPEPAPKAKAKGKKEAA